MQRSSSPCRAPGEGAAAEVLTRAPRMCGFPNSGRASRPGPCHHPRAAHSRNSPTCGPNASGGGLSVLARRREASAVWGRWLPLSCGGTGAPQRSIVTRLGAADVGVRADPPSCLDAGGGNVPQRPHGARGAADHAAWQARLPAQGRNRGDHTPLLPLISVCMLRLLAGGCPAVRTLRAGRRRPPRPQPPRSSFGSRGRAPRRRAGRMGSL